MTVCFLYVTVANEAEAKQIGRVLVAEKLAACVNILPEVTSIYEWQGEVCEGRESVLIVKLTDELSHKAAERIIELHASDCPCVAKIPITGGNPEFLAWIAAQTA